MKHIRRFNESVDINGLQDVKDEILFDILDNFPLHKECLEPTPKGRNEDVLHSDFEDYGQILWSICRNADYTKDTFLKTGILVGNYLPNQYTIYVRYICAPRATKDLGFVDMLGKKVSHWNNIGWDAKMSIKSDDKDSPAFYAYAGDAEYGDDRSSTWSENLEDWVNVNLITITLNKTKKSV